MKRLLIISIVLTVAGIGLILFSDPVLSLAAGGTPTIGNGQGPFSFNSTGTPGSSGSSGLPSGCHQQGQNFICGNGSGSIGPVGIGSTTSIIITVAGIGLCGVGMFLTAIESISKATGSQTRTVT